MRRRRTNNPTLTILVAVIGAFAPTARPETGRPPAIPCLPLATEKPIIIHYRVQRTAPLTGTIRAYAGPVARPIAWTPSGVRSAADLGSWTYERDRMGHWTSEFTLPRPPARGASSADEWRYRAQWRGGPIEITMPLDPDQPVGSYGPPTEFVADLAGCTLPFVLAAPEPDGRGAPVREVSDFLSRLDASDAQRTERGWEVSALIRAGEARLNVETDEEGRLLRIEETSVRTRHDGPVRREVIEIDEVRVMAESQMPWRFVRTVYDGTRLWERLEYEVIEVVEQQKSVEQVSAH